MPIRLMSNSQKRWWLSFVTMELACTVPPKQRQSGIAAISLGDVERVLPLVRRNVRLLADAVRQGHQIVTSEPAAALALRP